MKCFGITDVLFWHHWCTILGITDVLFWHQWCTILASLMYYFGITDVLFWHYLCTILALMYYSGIIDVLFHQWCYIFELLINCLKDLCMHSLIRYRRQYDISLDFVPSFLHKQLLSQLSLTFIFLPHLLAVKFYYHILL